VGSKLRNETVAKGGGLMIGVGPSAHGDCHPEAIRQMKSAGNRLHVNGEAIYATRPREGARWSEGDLVRYTRSKDRPLIYALPSRWPGAQVILTRVRPHPRCRIVLLGSNAELQWKWDSTSATMIDLPENLQQPSNRPCDFAWSLKMEAADA
jgi:alpha-L-fucosidase